jgi:hypothetical protein
MRGKKSYNIRNIEAHIKDLQHTFSQEQLTNPFPLPFRNMVFQTNIKNQNVPSEQQKQNEYINAQYGVSKYASNLVSGKMFKNV